ncbi:MAG: FIST signal transduction protein [Cyanobacteriota bacterium]
MLQFSSGNTRSVNVQRAALEALELAGLDRTNQPDLVLFHAAVGHDLARLSAAIQAECPAARVLGVSCGGVVGRDGPGESMHDIALMAVRGKGFAVSHVDGLHGDTSFDKGIELAQGLLGTPEPLRMLYLLASGIDTANDRLIAGIESVLGPEVVIFGGTSSDQMQGVATFQAIDAELFQHAALAVGFWDPGLEVETQASHGFMAMGEPLRVTRSAVNRIVELDGAPAWSVFLERLGLPPDAAQADTIPIGALAERLPAALAAEYGNSHILRAVTHHSAAGEIIYATTCAEGRDLWLTVRDEERIFSDLDRMLQAMAARRPGALPVAVFHADCLARGRRLFSRVMKEELVHRMQEPFSDQGIVPPWLGLYGFGEYARLGGANAYHNYTTALAALYRREPAASP